MAKPYIGGILAILGGVLIVAGAIFDEAFPKTLWIVAAACQFVNAFMLLKFCKRPTDSDKDKHEDTPQ